MSTEPSPASRGKSAAATRQALLAAARSRFLEESYENVGMREIAGDVGVDVALVSRYFGSKEDLFREVLGVEGKKEILPPTIQHDEIPGYLAALFLEQNGDLNKNVESLLIILRSASSPAASQIVREALRRDVLSPLAERLGGDSPEMRASTSMAVWMGMTIMRTIMAVEPLRECGVEIQQRMRLLFEAALSDAPCIDAGHGHLPA